MQRPSSSAGVHLLPFFGSLFQDSSDLSAFLHDNLRVHSRSGSESRDREQGRCGSCGVNQSQLKQEAVHLALNRGHALAQPIAEPSFSMGTLPGLSGTRHGDRTTWEAEAAAHQPRSHTHSPHSPRSPRTPQRTPQTLRRRGPKLPNPNMDRWVEEQQQLVASKSCSDGVAGYHRHQVPPKSLPLPLNHTPLSLHPPPAFNEPCG